MKDKEKDWKDIQNTVSIVLAVISTIVLFILFK